MWDNGATRRWRIRFPITKDVLGVALTVSLAFLAYLLLRPDVRAVAFSPMAQAAHTAGAESPVVGATTHGVVTLQGQGGTATVVASAQISPTSESSAIKPISTDMPMKMNMQPTGNGAVDTPVPANADAMTGQLQEMQRSLQTMSDQLGLRSASGAPLPVLPTPIGASAGIQGGTPVSEADVSAMMAEIDQLYQVMQPLMERLQNASQSSRSPGELAAMRTQMDDIHRQLTSLMQRVQAAKDAATAASQGVRQAQPGAANAQLGSQVNPNRATLDQLQQSMSQLQSLLQQMQSGAAPNGQ